MKTNFTGKKFEIVFFVSEISPPFKAKMFQAKEMVSGHLSDPKPTPWQAITALCQEIEEQNQLEQLHKIELEKLARWQAVNGKEA